MANVERRFDAIVIGSGPGGSTAVKELTERGLEVLLLDAGREVREEDFIPPVHKKPAVMGMDLVPRAKAMASGQFRQACRPYFSPASSRFLVNDFEDPYTHPLNHPYLWVRSKLLGGRMHSYGRVLQRMSDVDFHAASGRLRLGLADQLRRPGAVVRAGRDIGGRLRRRRWPGASAGWQLPRSGLPHRSRA